MRTVIRSTLSIEGASLIVSLLRETIARNALARSGPASLGDFPKLTPIGMDAAKGVLAEIEGDLTEEETVAAEGRIYPADPPAEREALDAIEIRNGIEWTCEDARRARRVAAWKRGPEHLSIRVRNDPGLFVLRVVDYPSNVIGRTLSGAEVHGSCAERCWQIAIYARPEALEVNDKPIVTLRGFKLGAPPSDVAAWAIRSILSHSDVDI